jgi:hypothetical protein
MKSWKTTAGGFITAATMLLPQAQAALNGGAVNWESVIGALSLAFAAWHTRDKDVSSEQQGVK